MESSPFLETPSIILAFFNAVTTALHATRHRPGRIPATTHPVIHKKGKSISKQYTHTDALVHIPIAKVRIRARLSVDMSLRLLQCRIATVISPTGTARYITCQSTCKVAA